MNHFWQVSGIIFWCILGVSIILRLIYGKNWLLKIGANTFFGAGLITSIKTLIQESKQRDIKEDTVAKVGAHIIWRLTRVGIFALLFALIPFLLLFQQNQLIGKQNELITFQNKRIDKQTELDSLQTIKLQIQNDLFLNQNNLFADQNIKVTKQTNLLEDQNRLFGNQNLLVRSQNTRVDSQLVLMRTQNDLFVGQNERIDTQNDRIRLQNNLIEADRRSSLVFLMSNILDKVDEEIKTQKKLLNNKKFNAYDKIFKLSHPLVGRIVALSKTFKPYRILEGDKLSGLVSPERGQLFISLMKSQLDSFTQNTIVADGDFSNAIIGRAHLSNLNLANASLSGSNLDRADLTGTNLSEANLRDASLKTTIFRGANLRWAILDKSNIQSTNFQWANLRQVSFIDADLSYSRFDEADLREADLRGANLDGVNYYGADMSSVNFGGVKNLNVNRLAEAKTLFQCENLLSEIESQLQKENPCLFTKEGCNVEPAMDGY